MSPKSALSFLTVVGVLALAPGGASADDSLFGPPIIISGSVIGPISIHAADLDGDGDLDLLSASWADDTIRWFENTDGVGSFGPEQVLSTVADRAYSVHAADFDGDLDMDVLSASFSDSTIAWYENVDGQGTFSAEKPITTTATGVWSAQAGDLDGDGDADVAAVTDTIDTVFWYENTDGLGTFGPPITLSTTTDGGVNISIADIDGDLDNDLLVCSALDDTVAWFENLDGAGNFGTAQPIVTTANGVRSAHAADLDGDDDLDVLSASGLDNTISWNENTDGDGSFGPRQVITNQAITARTVWSADLDGDGDQDVLSASLQDDTVAWYENLDGLGSFGPERVISNTVNAAFTVRAYDFDGDGDDDVVAAALEASQVGWFENSAANWTDLGGGTPGSSGTPALLGCGPLSADSTATLELTDAPAGALMLAWISFTSSPFAALGGTVHAFPTANQLFLPADAQGSFSGTTTWPTGLPTGSEVWFQFLVEDGSTAAGITLSNGVRATTP